MKLVAKAFHITTDPGGKAVRGVLNWLASRPAFVSEPGHRVRLVSLPKHRSGQNHIAVVVGAFLQQVSRGGLFTLVAGLRFKLLKGPRRLPSWLPSRSA